MCDLVTRWLADTWQFKVGCFKLESKHTKEGKYMTERFIDLKYTHIPAKTQGITRKWLDVPYMDGERHGLDIYLPNEGNGPYPVIVDIYGGGLYRGEKSSMKMDASLRLLREYGYAVVSPNYSMLWQAPFPTQIYEIKAALRFLHANADQYELDMNRVALVGESSGAQLAVTVAATQTVGAMEDHSFGLYPEASEAVNAVIALYGPYEFDKFEEQFAESGVTSKFPEVGTAESFQGQLFGQQAPKDVPELVKAYNPATYFTAEMPAILGFAGTADPVVPYQQTVNMMTSAREVLGRAKTPYHLIEGGVHGPANYMTPEWTAVKAEFLDHILNEVK